MRSWLHRSFLLCLCAAAVHAQPAPLETQPEPAKFPCRIADYRIMGKSDLLLYCDPRVVGTLKFDVTISELDDLGEPISGSGRSAQFVKPEDDYRWATVRISRVLESRKSYRLYTLPMYSNKPYVVTTFDFDTKPSASIEPIVDVSHSSFADRRKHFALLSKVALDETSFPNGNLRDEFAKKTIPSTFCPLEFAAKTLLAVGVARIDADLSGLKSLSTRVVLSGIRNVFGEVVEVSAKQLIQVPGAPADKDSAEAYFKFLNQSGSGKPGWAADVKFAPQVAGIGQGFYLTPVNATADLGFGVIPGNKTTDMVKIGTGITGYIPSASMQLTPQASFETDRHGHHQNILADFDVQYFGPKWIQTIKSKNEEALAKNAFESINGGGKPPDTASILTAEFGFLFQLFTGTELGGARSADTAKSSDKATSVTIPTYGIARLRPKVSMTLEYKRLSFTLSATPRYLFRTENVTRESNVPSPSDPSKSIAQIRLSQVKGFKPFAEAGIAYALDREGHYAFSVAYKLGSLPPNFDRVNTVQTGLVVKF